jgi:sugar/nucleoside kinase (ribokinase family)
MKEFIRFPDKEIGPVLGGPAAYSSVAASVLGLRTGLVTVIGQDASHYIIEPLIDAGVDTLGLRIGECDTRTNILTYDADGGKTAHYDTVASPIQPDDIPADYLLARAFFVCPMDFEVQFDTVARLKQTGSLLMTDLGGYGGAVSTNHPAHEGPDSRRRLQQLVSKFDIVKASTEDTQCLFPGDLGPDESARLFVEWGAKVAMITMGERGSLLWDGDVRHVVPAFPAEVMDVTGAGDVYCGAFLVDFLRGGQLFEAAVYGAAAASLVVEKSGGTSVARMPVDRQVRERLRLHSGKMST